MMRCIVCGGDHEPSSDSCDSAGMDKEIARLGSHRWNRLTGHVMRQLNKKIVERIKRSSDAGT